MSIDLIQPANAPMPQRLTPRAEQFIASVLALDLRLACFDCDGTLWSGDAGADFFYWEIEQGLLPPDVVRWIRPRYDDYKAGKVDEEAMCGEMVTIHKGLREADLRAAAARFFADVVQPRIFPEMLELTRRLNEAGCELWAVSSTNDWVVAEGARQFGIPIDRILAACVHCESGVASNRLIRVPTDEGKAVAIREVIGRQLDAAFGNSIHDAAMLDIATHAFAINPNANLEELARLKNWTIYHPERLA
jgi:phosphoserine phosphatase